MNRRIPLVLAATLLCAASTPSPSPAANLQDLQQFSNAFADLAARVKPAVVAVQTEKEVEVSDPFQGTPFEDFFRGHPGMRQQQGPDRQLEQGLGSGVIVSRDGYILTNNHVIVMGERRDDAVADRITIEMADQRTFQTKVVGRDPLTDLAVLKIDSDDDLPFLNLGDSDKLRVGEWVVAVGNPFGQLHTVTTGIVSAMDRGGLFRSRDPQDNPYQDFIQTDAAINPGNSGGALVNTRGELVGINSAIVSRSGGSQGLGFAIPANLARTVMDQLVEHGEVRRGQLGVLIKDISPEMEDALKLPNRRGALVSQVLEDSPAEKAGLEVYDVIIEVDGKPTHSTDELRTMVAHTPPGTKVKVKVRRDGDVKTIEVKLGELEATSAMAPSKEAETTSKLGMAVRELDDQLAERLGFQGQEGVVIEQIEPGSPAARAGLQRGDLIAEIDRRPITSVDDYEKAIDKASGTALILVQRSRGGTVRTGVFALRLPD